jgi:hypothetical protein
MHSTAALKFKAYTDTLSKDLGHSSFHSYCKNVSGRFRLKKGHQREASTRNGLQCHTCGALDLGVFNEQFSEFIKLDGSSPCSQKPTTGPSLETLQSSSHLHNLLI